MTAAPIATSAIYTGTIRHHRREPIENRFEYPLFMMYLDLDELPTLFDGRLFWSVERPNLASFRRADHHGSPSAPLAESIRELVEEESGARPAGPIRLLTHLSYFGYRMNPVSFFFCFGADERLEAIVAEVNNTPWGEQHCYVLSTSTSSTSGDTHRFELSKQFHVSPFMPMAIDYEWAFSVPGERLVVQMTNLEAGARIFDSVLTMERREISSRSLAGSLARFPLLSGQILLRIYLQAARLWWKGVRFHPHPSKRSETPT